MVKDAFGRRFFLKNAVNCVGEGWRDLVIKCYAACFKYNVPIYQIKEKFGGLRIYTGGAPQKVADIIDQAEQQSYTICEKCGNPGEVRENGRWLFTLCRECYANFKNTHLL